MLIPTCKMEIMECNHLVETLHVKTMLRRSGSIEYTKLRNQQSTDSRYHKRLAEKAVSLVHHQNLSVLSPFCVTAFFTWKAKT